MTILDNGRVGIGTTNPVSALTLPTGSKISFTDNFDHRSIFVPSGEGEPLVLTNHGAAGNPTIRFRNIANGSDKMVININTGNVGIGTTQFGFFNILGQPFTCKFNVAGFSCAFSFPVLSDQSLKKNVSTLTNSLNKVVQLRGVNFEWDLDTLPEPIHMAGTQIGFVAQEVGIVLPEVVYQTDSNILSVDYARIVPVLVEAVKELSSKYDSLKNTVIQCCSHNDTNNFITICHNSNTITVSYSALQAHLNHGDLLGPCPPDSNARYMEGVNNKGGTNKTFINSTFNIVPDNSLNGKNTKLFQNYPNPFSYSTKFNYTIAAPGNVELLIHTFTGQYVTTLVSEQQNEGSYTVNWDTADIPPGLYFYTLTVDGMEWVKKAIRVK